MSAAKIFLAVGTTIVLLIALVAMTAYLLAVKHGYRDYRHIFLAFPFVIIISTTGTLGLLDIGDGNILIWIRGAGNLVGLVAMIDLAKRFWRPKDKAKAQMGSSASSNPEASA